MKALITAFIENKGSEQDPVLPTATTGAAPVAAPSKAPEVQKRTAFVRCGIGAVLKFWA
jgi:hypothetical protein